MSKLKAAVIGYPVEQSLSPLIHTHWLQKYKIDGEYKALTIQPENLAQWVDTLIKTGYAGFNVTLPHKIGIMAFCDTLAPLAQEIGAVNTVTIDKNGALHGTNTDVYGFQENLREQQPDWNPAQGPALVLGAGGAARAVVYALLDMGVPQVTLCNRTADRAHVLAQEEFCRGRVNVIDWAARKQGVFASSLLVNTTNLGMVHQPPLEIDLSDAGCLVYDIVYRPQKTALLQQAERMGLPIVTGLGMLLHQARPAFESWFGVLPDIDDTLIAAVRQKAAS